MFPQDSFSKIIKVPDDNLNILWILSEINSSLFDLIKDLIIDMKFQSIRFSKIPKLWFSLIYTFTFLYGIQNIMGYDSCTKTIHWGMITRSSRYAILEEDSCWRFICPSILTVTTHDFKHHLLESLALSMWRRLILLLQNKCWKRRKVTKSPLHTIIKSTELIFWFNYFLKLFPFLL